MGEFVNSRDELLDNLYHASTDETGWPGSLGAVTGYFGASWSGLIETGNSSPGPLKGVGQPSRSAPQSGIPLDPTRLCAAYYAARNPWLLAFGERPLTGWIGPGSIHCPPAQFEWNEFYNEFVRGRRFPVFHQLGVMITPSGGSQTLLTVLREEQQNAFNDDEIRDLRSLVPHLQRVLQIHREMTGLRQFAEGTGSILESLDVAAIALDRSCEVCFANGLAESILQSGDMLRLPDGRLAAPLAHETVALRKLAEGASPGAWKEQAQGGNLTVRSGERSLYLTVIPLASPIRGASHQADVLVTITLDTAPQPRDRSLTSLFQLTPAEIRVSMLLLEGLEPKDVAERMGVTYETVRFRLKIIYRKMGVTRQTQLVRLLSRLPGRQEMKHVTMRPRSHVRQSDGRPPSSAASSSPAAVTLALSSARDEAA